jgi:hypothetical protein
MYHEFATDPVIQCLAFEDQRHYVMLLCLKCNGTLDRKITPANRDRLIRRALGLDSVAAEEAKRRLMEMKLITKNWHIEGWDKRQYISDHSTERARKSRKNKKTRNGQEALQQQECNAPDTDTDTDTDSSSSGKPKEGEKDVQFAMWMYHKIQLINEHQKKPNWNVWAKDIRLMQTRDGRNLKDMAVVFNWANTDPFWQSNILSPAKFRQQYDTLLIKMRGKDRGQNQSATTKRGPSADSFFGDSATDF